jgi:hypothetical protein
MHSIAHQKQLLWPYSKILAIISIPLIWTVFLIILAVLKQFANWPTEETLGSVTIGILILSFIPFILVLLDFLAARGAVITTKYGGIDFSKINLNETGIKQETFGLPDNIGISGPIISDTAPMDIISTLRKAIDYEIVIINIKDGDAWWVTRLLALSVGALRAGSPKIFAFIGKKGNISNTFLGWGWPKDILQAILKDNIDYKTRYDKAIKIAKQVIMFSDDQLLPQGMMLSNDILRYVNDENFTKLGEAVTEQIIMDQMAMGYGYNTGSLEDNPDKITLNRLNELFGYCLYTSSIDLSWSNETQIKKLINSNTDYLALIRNAQYESMLKVEAGERLILKELLEESKADK